jgi:2'-5' RNA ligase
MRHRIFIAINLPEEIKKELKASQSQWPELPIRWTKPENLHITLVFLGYLSDEDLLEVCNLTREVAQRNKPFSLNLKKICYGPPKKMPPRMVWVEGEKSQELGDLKNDLENSLLEGVSFHREKRAFSLHITLGRIRRWEWKKIEPEERPEVNKEIDLTFEVNSIEVMESKLKRGGAEYTVLESTPLKL